MKQGWGSPFPARALAALGTWLLVSGAGAAAPARSGEPAAAAGTLRIYLARHGQTDWNAARRLQGWTDTHLNTLGREQASALALRLRGLALDRVYCSRLARSRETAEIVHGAAPVESLAGLDEQRLGAFEGLRLDGSEPERQAEWRRRSRDPDDALDGGESRNQHFERVRAAVERIRTRHSSGAILVVGHGGANRHILRALLGLTAEQAAQIDQANDELYLIEQEPGGTPRLFKLIPEANLKEL